MSFIWRGGNTLNGRTEFVSIGVLLGILVGLTALPISGCSQSASQSSCGRNDRLRGDRFVDEDAGHRAVRLFSQRRCGRDRPGRA